MSKLSDLIAQLCPLGVEFKTLDEISTKIFRGSGITREQVTAEGVPCVRYGEIYTTYGIYFDKCVSHTSIEKISNPKYFEHGDILFAITGEKVEDIAKSTAYVGNEKCLAGGDIVVLKHNQNPKYLSYVLSTVEAVKQKTFGKIKSKVVHSSVPAIKEIKIPVPPLEVQKEIVRILDTFTELIEKLSEELSEELSLRKKQYEFYRDKLLTFGDEVEFKKLGEIALIRRGVRVVRSQLSENGKYAVYQNSMTPLGYYENFNCLANTTFVISAGAAGEIGYSYKNFWAADDCLYIECDKNFNSRFLYYLLLCQQKFIYSNVRRASVPRLSKELVQNLKIPIPPIEEQERIVKILDRFDKLCNDLSEGLPAEISLRKKQYEFYRDKLLTFEEKKS